MSANGLSIKGRVATPADADWDEARQAWNLVADQRPSAVAFVEDAEDVAKVIDRGRSSRNGAYAMVGDFSGSNGATIRAARKVIGPRGHHRVCDPGSVPAD